MVFRFVGLLVRSKGPERTGPASAVGYCLTIKATTFRALRLDGLSRRAFSRHGLRQKLTEALRSRIYPRDAFAGDFFIEGRGFIHAPPFQPTDR